MSLEPYRAKTTLRIRTDDGDGTGAITVGGLFALADEARFDLYAGLTARGRVIPKGDATRAERLRVARLPLVRESITIEAFLTRVGNTSVDIDHTFHDERGERIAVLSSTVVAIEAKRPVAWDRTLSADVAPPLGVVLDPPAEPDGSVAFLRTLDAWPAHENPGGHVARTRIVDWLVDAYRLGTARGAFEHAGAGAPASIASVSVSFEKESFAGDGLRIAVASAGANVFDASLVRSGAVVARARLVTRPID